MEISTEMGSRTKQTLICSIPKSWRGERSSGKYCAKLYVFISPQDRSDRHIRDSISIKLVRLAQRGNELAKQELMELISYTIDDWIDHHLFLARWRGYEVEIRTQVERCIRRYRYSGSFLRYIFRTLEYAGRGIRPLQAYSFDEPIFDGPVRKIEMTGHARD